MRYSKFASWAISALVFLVVASLLVNFAMIAVDFYDGLDARDPDGESDAPDVGGAELPNVDEDNGGNGNTESLQYVTNLSYAYGDAYVEGLLRDISSLGQNDLEALYLKLIDSVSEADTVKDVSLAPVGIYDGENTLLVRSELTFEGGLVSGKKTVKVAVKKTHADDPSIKNADIKVVYEEREVDVNTVEPYMGYIIINSEDGKRTLYDADGKMLLEELGDKTPANKRTLSGVPVFADASGAYYVFEGTDVGFVAVSEEDIALALEYDYPAYSYTKENGEMIYAKYDKSSKKYKFYNSATGKEEFSTKYNFAYTLGANGYAFVKDTGGICCMIDASGKVVHKPPTDNVYHYPISGVNQGYYARRYYEIPYVSDISAIGCERVDENGWIRVRIRLIGRSSAVYNQVIADYEALVNISGEFFDIPSGYTIEAYSDGVLLLSKDGRYGYYSTEGKWIAQPIFTYAEPFIQGLAVVGHETGTRGMIDTQGNIVLPFVFSHISNVSSAIVTAYSEVGGWETFRLVSKNDAEQVQNP